MLHITREMFETHAPAPISQGEVSIWMYDLAPLEIREAADKCEYEVMKLEHDKLILGHSETGHHHVLEPVDKTIHVSQVAQALIDKTNDLFVSLTMYHDGVVNHLRGYDTHNAFKLSAGYKYIIRPDDEQVVEGWRKVAD
jgi:hypothetical protein